MENNTWIKVADRLPENSKFVIGSNGKSYYKAFYTKGNLVPVECDEDNEWEYAKFCDTRGEYYLIEGWYSREETPGGPYDQEYVRRDIQIWQPFPALPPKE